MPLQNKLKNIHINFNGCVASNNFLKTFNSKPQKFNLTLTYDIENFIIKLTKKASIDLIKPKYNWIKYYEPEDHLNNLINKIIDMKILNKESSILGYSFKDISTVDKFKNRGFKNCKTLHPKNHLNIKTSNYGVETIESHFNKMDLNNKFKNIRADLFIVRHTFEHCYNLKKFIHQTKKIVNKNKYVLFEFPDCSRYFKNFDYTMLWEEHTYYFTIKTFENLLFDNHFDIVFKKKYKYPLEDSIVFLVKKKNKKINTKKRFAEDRKRFLNIFKNYKLFLKKDINETHKIFLNYKKKFPKNKISIYGAGHFTSTFVYVYKLHKFIDYVIDDNKNKIKYYFPTGKIKIVSSSALSKNKISICLLGIIPNNQKKVIQKNKKFTKYCKFFTIFKQKSHQIKHYKNINKLYE